MFRWEKLGLINMGQSDGSIDCVESLGYVCMGFGKQVWDK